MPHIKKWAVLVVVAGLLTGLDYWSKRWADATLGSDEHPLPVLVRADEAGRSIRDVLAARFPDLAEDADQVARKEVRAVQLPAPGEVTGEQNAFGPLRTSGGRFRTPILWAVFHRGDFEQAPRVVPLLERPLTRRWLSLALNDVPRSQHESYLDAEFETDTVARYLAERVPSNDESDIAEAAAAGRVVPIYSLKMGVAPDRTVKEGELFLLHDRRVHVIPGFFQFDYKENPGAAWGIFGQARAEFRQIFLTSVSGLASLIILIIFARLQPTHWSAILAFSAILSGAVGNLIDRASWNFVIDFFDMYISYAHWPTYNIADVGISVGVVALVFEMLFVKSSPFAQLDAPRGQGDSVPRDPAADADQPADGADDDTAEAPAGNEASP